MAGAVEAGGDPRGTALAGRDGGRVPSVVAVLPTRDPGPWFEETLAALAAQDYPELSVLVLVTGGTGDVTERVARVLPSAYVRRLRSARTYAAAVDEALEMVEGAAFFLLCHDDCAPDPDAVHVMVEESFRSNAGIVTPKMLRWDDPSVLLHVGQHVDPTGAVVERVQPGEVDHGQHDAVMDVFAAPGGFTLVRADLMEELGGYDRAMVAMGEDLDLCWRAHVAGARVVVAPDARVRHLEVLAGGGRSLPSSALGPGPVPTLQALQRRHELRAVLTATSRLRLLFVLSLAFLLAMGEIAVSLAAGDHRRVRTVADAWRWNLSRAGELRRRRAAVQRRRVLSDRQVRAFQLRGSARLGTYFSRLAHQGFEVATGLRVPPTEGATEAGGVVPVLTGSVGTSFSEDADFDELDDLGRRSGRDRFGRRAPRRLLATRRSRLVAWLVATLLLVIGSRGLLSGSLPLVGQFAPFLSWTATWHQLVAAWQPAGVGTGAPASPGFAVLGLLGTVLLGHMGQLQKLLVLGAFPIGAWGASRLLRPFGSPRARFASALCYLAIALPYDALAGARWDGLIAYAVAPWFAGALARASGRAPYGLQGEGWRATLLGQVVVLGALETVAVALAPVTALVLLVIAGGFVLGSAAVGDRRAAVRVALTAVGATAGTAVLVLPWLVGTLSGGSNALSVLGMASPASGLGWSALLRFDVGPVGGSVLSWFLLGAAVLPLLVARQQRLAWAGRLWAAAGCSWLVALVAARGWAAPFTPSVAAVLTPAAVGVAGAVGLGVTAFEKDLAGYAFGWRQLASVAAVVAVAVGLLPVLAETADGRWGLPTAGYRQALASVTSGTAAATAGYRVLWLGAPQVLPTGSWPVNSQLAFATTENGLPDARNLWLPASPGPAAALGRDVTLAAEGRTVRLGRLLSVAAVRYVVVVDGLAPVVTGGEPVVSVPPPSGLTQGLAAQEDLLQAPSSAPGFEVFVNTDFVPERAARTGGPVPSAAGRPTTSDVQGWRPALTRSAGEHAYTGHVRGGTVLSLAAPGGSWQLVANGEPVSRRSAYGWASQYTGVPAGTATLRFRGSPLDPAVQLGEMALWLTVAGALLGRRRWLDWWWLPIRRRRAAARALRASRAARARERAAASRSPARATAGEGDHLTVVASPDPAPDPVEDPAAQPAPAEPTAVAAAEPTAVAAAEPTAVAPAAPDQAAPETGEPRRRADVRSEPLAAIPADPADLDGAVAGDGSAPGRAASVARWRRRREASGPGDGHETAPRNGRSGKGLPAAKRSTGKANGTGKADGKGMHDRLRRARGAVPGSRPVPTGDGSTGGAT